MQRRTRNHVTIMGSGQEEQAVVIAYSPGEMKSLVCKLYKNLIIDDGMGLPSGEISFETTELL